MRLRPMTVLLLVATLALLAGCSDDDSALLDDGNDDPCLNCHGDQELLMSMLPEEEGAAPVGRGDG
jgi:hypothetical protein